MADEKELVDLLVQNLDVSNGRNSSSFVSSQTQANHYNQNSSLYQKQQRKGKSKLASTKNSEMEANYSRQNQQYNQMDRSRDIEWAEYVQFVNLPGLAISPAQTFSQQNDIHSNQTYPNNQTLPIDSSLLTMPSYIPDSEEPNYNEADFVQDFVGSAPQYVPYLHPGYFQHPGFASQVYNGHNVFSGNNFYPYLQFAQMIPDPNNYDQQYKQQSHFNNYTEKTIQPPQQNGKHEKIEDEVAEILTPVEETQTVVHSQKSSNGNAQKQDQQPSGPKSWAQIANKAASKPQVAQPAPPPVKAPSKPPSSPQKKSETKNEAKSEKVEKQEKIEKTSSAAPVRPEFADVNPVNFDIRPPFARLFVIKSYSEDDIHKSIKYGIWASTDSGNKRLDAAYKESSSKGPIYLFYSVNTSGQFCGMAQMTSSVDYEKKSEHWMQDKWKGIFTVKWIFIKDIPNNQLRHIRLENNENKPVTNSRDTQEIFYEPGLEVLKIFASYKAKTSILDDFGFYDKRQETMKEKKQAEQQDSQNSTEEGQEGTGSYRSPRVRGSSKPESS